MKDKAQGSSEQRRANIMRFGLMAIPPIAWAVTFAPLFLVSNGFYGIGSGYWIGDALIPSLIVVVVVAAVCIGVWFAYKRLVLRST